MATTSVNTNLKRKAVDILVDPDTLKEIEDAKKPKIDLNATKKFSCISSVIGMYAVVIKFLVERKIYDAGKAMDTDDIMAEDEEGIGNNITAGNHIMSIIFTIHNVNRQSVKGKEFIIIKKTKTTSYKVHYKGKDHTISNETINKMWLAVLKQNGLEYKDFDPSDEKAWYGSMGPYLDMFSAYPLRINELRLGHNNMPITKVDGVHKSFPVSKYGLSGAHHVLQTNYVSKGSTCSSFRNIVCLILNSYNTLYFTF